MSSSLCFFDSKWEQLANTYTLNLDHKGVFGSPHKLICIGDIHGDFELLFNLLVHVAQVIKPVETTCELCTCGFFSRMKTNEPTLHNFLPCCTFEWSGEPGTWVVFLGDFLDRRRGQDTVCYPKSHNTTTTTITTTAEDDVYDGELANEEIAIVDFINFVSMLANQAHNHSNVIKLLGNHELMNLDPLFNNSEYVTPRALHDTSTGLGFCSGLAGRKQAFGVNGILRKKLALCGCYGLVQIDRALCMHGGLNEHFSTHPIFQHVFLHPIIADQCDSILRSSHHAASIVPQVNTLIYQWLHDKTIQDETDQVIRQVCDAEHSYFWERAQASDQFERPDFKEWSHLLNSTIRSGLDPSLCILIVGHCVQVNRFSEPNSSASCKFIERAPDQDNGHTMPHMLCKHAVYCDYNYVHDAAHHRALNTATSLKIPWHGIQFHSLKNKLTIGSVCKKGQIYMCDVGMSRAFDMFDEVIAYKEGSIKHQQMLNFRAPQVLQFDCANNWEPSVLVQRFHLYRKWLKNHLVNV